METNISYNSDCIEVMRTLPNQSVDCILTDPPYLYLKNQKLDRPFDEAAFFDEAKRVLKRDGFIVLFGRGTSFYRWNTMLAERGFNFKEEVVWNKSHCTSPLMALSRVHETISIHTKGKGVINRVKVPYLEMKGHDIAAIVGDIKRMKAILNNTKSLDAVLQFLQTNDRDTSDAWGSNNISISSGISKEDRGVSVVRSIRWGMSEKSIVRTDFERSEALAGKGLFGDRRTGARACNVMQGISVGMTEKSIIRQTRDHYSAIHPTQKPVRLLERLMALVTKPGDTVLDPFAGSHSTAVACLNTDRRYICCEIDKEYYDAGTARVAAILEESKLGLPKSTSAARKAVQERILDELQPTLF